ncbi:MAG: hypothetical protein LBK28_00535 [Propionibacteriaceae bacterium]|nr:hypothetical protein [Propionibacteriaceae bacterium]
MDGITIHPHALEHDQTREDIYAALYTETGSVLLHREPDSERWILTGFNTHGNLIQIVKVVFETGGVLVIHCMKAQKETVAMIDRARRMKR